MKGRRLLSSMLTVGMIGFGGGSALIPVIEEEIVEKKSLIDRDTYTRHTVVGNITPGALPPKLAALAGEQVAGMRIAVLAALVVALPGTLTTVLFMAVSGALGASTLTMVSYASVGVNAFIIVLMLGYIAKVIRSAPSRRASYLLIMIATILASGSNTLIRVVGLLVGRHWKPHLPRLSAVQVIVGALVLIAVISLLKRGSNHQVRSDEMGAGFKHYLRGAGGFLLLALVGCGTMVLLLGVSGARFAGLLALSTVTSFGGGEAYVAVADGFFVNAGLVESSTFYTHLVPIANALPGPILVKIAAGMSYLTGLSVGPLHAWGAALAAIAITVGSCCMVVVLVYGAYDQLKTNRVFVNISTYVLPVICGLLVTTSLTMLRVSAEIAASAEHSPTVLAWVSLTAIMGMFVIHHRKLIPDLVLLLGAGGCALALLV